MRDNFKAKTKLLLAQRVAYHCSNPTCGRSTIGPASKSIRAILTGDAAHILSAAEGGKRYDSTITPDQRASIENGIWLCKVCHALIDGDEIIYTSELLRSWKKQAETKAQQEQLTISSEFTLSTLEFQQYLRTYVEMNFEQIDKISLEDFILWIIDEGEGSLSPQVLNIVEYVRTSHIESETLMDYFKSLYSVKNTMSKRVEHQIATATLLLDIAARSLTESSTVHGVISPKIALSPASGTFAFRWRVGPKAPYMLLVDFVGGVLENRLSVLTNEDNSLKLRVFDSEGNEFVSNSKSYEAGTLLHVFVTWVNRVVKFWVEGELVHTIKMKRPFNFKWAKPLVGIDITGELGADYAGQGYYIDGVVGLNLGRGGISEGLRISDFAIWDRELPKDLIIDLSLEPRK
jgi:hypothetical protein